MGGKDTNNASAAASAPLGSTATYDAEPQPTQVPMEFSQAPWYLLLQDAILVLTQIKYLPGVFLPLNLDRGGIFEDLTLLGLAYQVVTVLITLAIIPFGVTSLVTGFPSPILVILGSVSLIWLLYLLQGADTIIQVPPDPSGKFKNETWLFVNGIATTTSGHKKAIARLKELFDRDCIGINNKSLGFILDILECIVQRDLHWRTTSIRKGYQVLKQAVYSGKSRIVLIGHSQGGLQVSEWADQLLAEVPANLLKRIEVYTFASAANHFSAPLNLDGSQPFAVVEHFAQTRDFVARIGVLAFSSPQQAQLPIAGKMDPSTGDGPAADPSPPGSAPTVVESKFAGRLFVRCAQGHLLNSHYLGKENILKSPAAQRYSRLAKYLDGGLPA